MAKIISKLNLNKTPQLVENNSLVYAKNIRALKDGTISPDASFDTKLEFSSRTSFLKMNDSYKGAIVGLRNKIYLFLNVTSSNDLNNVKIYEYDENLPVSFDPTHNVYDNPRLLNCSWKYSGGKIDGKVTVNITGEEILTICEYFDEYPTETNANSEVPIKHINIQKCEEISDDSLFTQNPNIPITNVYLDDYYTCIIPNGVYQFFIRYNIRDEFYTDWFPCSKELFAGTPEITDTIQGQLKNVNLHKDSGKSFVLRVEHLYPEFNSLYKNYQLGFIISHDDSSVARAWKSFELKDTADLIYFNYNNADIEEIDIDDLTKVSYEIFNVKNVSYFRNKLYISNYKETDFNPNLAIIEEEIETTFPELAENINVELKAKALDTENNLYIDGLELEQIEDEELELYRVNDVFRADLSNVVVSEEISSETDEDTINDLWQVEMVAKNFSNMSQGDDIYYTFWYVKGVMEWDYKEGGQQQNSIKSKYIFNEYEDDTTHELKHNGRLSGTQTGYGFFKLYDQVGHYSYYAGNAADPDCVDHPLVTSGVVDNYNWYWNIADDDTTNDVKYGTGYSSVVGVRGVQDDDGRYRFSARGNEMGGYDIYDTSHNGVVTCSNILKQGIKRNYKDLILCSAYINYTGGTLYILGTNGSFGIDDNNSEITGLTYASVTAIDNAIKGWLNTNVQAIDRSGNYYILVNGEYKQVLSYAARYIEFNYKTSTDSMTYDAEVDGFIKFHIDADYVETQVVRSFYTEDAIINEEYNEYDCNTLMPYTNYQFYIHYVKQNGVNTNGYLIGNGTYNYDTYNVHNDLEVIYPVFSNIIVPNGYVSYFISIYKIGGDVARLFNHKIVNGKHYADCLECDALLYNLVDHINIYRKYNGSFNQVSANGRYLASGSTNPLSSFGNCGMIEWSDDDAITPEYETITQNVDIDPTLTNYLILEYETDTDQYPNVLTLTLSDYADVDEICDAITTRTNGLFTASYVSNESIVEHQNQELDEDLEGEGDVETFTEVQIDSYTITISTVEPNSVKRFLAEETDDPINIQDFHDQYDSLDYARNLTEDYWIVIDNDNSNVKNKRLIKMSPYLANTDDHYDEYEHNVDITINNINTDAYIATIKKLSHSSDKYYITGNDIYDKTVVGRSINVSLNTSNFGNLYNSYQYIPSNFNLNYCSLANDITPQIRKSTGESRQAGDDDIQIPQIVQAVQSLTSSSILELKAMYRDYTRKYYSPIDDSSIVIFDNTIRSSDVNSDEGYRHIYKFDAKDYYNVPTNRGVIVKLFNISDSIYVHCERSLYKFAGVNSLSSESGQVALQQGDIFDTGIKEMFDSENGHAGLQIKSQALVTFTAYFFYDKERNTIYGYGGETQLVELSDSIRKLLDSFAPNDVQFAADEINDRIFINLSKNINGQRQNICLSYNFKLKSFISIHDFDFGYAFSSRINSYFVSEFDAESSLPGIHGFCWQLNKIDINKIPHVWYASAYKQSYLSTTDDEIRENERAKQYTLGSVVDVICNVDYEKIKSVEYINWVCSEVLSYGFNNLFPAEETLRRNYPCSELRVYTDTCNSDILDLINPLNHSQMIISNDNDIANFKYNSYPRYNNGEWSLNYFRDIKQANNDAYNYINNTPLENRGTKAIYAQEDSLIYGKYIVFRLIFWDRNFKLENVTIKVKDYEKIH